MKKSIYILLLLGLVFQPGRIPDEVLAQSGILEEKQASDPDTDASQPRTGTNLDLLLPEDLNPPESCGVPMRGPFGQDVEIFLGPWVSENGAFRINQDPAWYGVDSLPNAEPYSNLSAVPLGTERIAAVWKQGDVSGPLHYSIWDASYENWGPPGTWGVKFGEIDDEDIPEGNPALIPLSDYAWEVYVRHGDMIEYMDIDLRLEDGDPGLAVWDPTNIENAASDPAVITMDPHHTMVFYKDLEGKVWFTEWIGVWRDHPEPLVGSYELTYLPIVNMSSPAGFGSSQAQRVSDQTSISGPSFSLASELSAYSRNSGHAAVFGVDAEGTLWVREWNSLNATDWSDTEWVKLMEGVKVEKPALTSMHFNHLGVAVRSTSGVPYYIEWTVASGWKEPVALSNIFASPLTLVATSIDSLSAIGIGEDGKAYQKRWTSSGGWDSWQTLTGSGIAQDQTLAGVVRRMDDIMLIGRNATSGAFSKHFTSQEQTLVESGLAPSGIKGYPRGQALPWADGDILWTSAYEDQVSAFWEMEAFNIHTSQSESLSMTNHPYSGQDIVSADQGDIDFNGDDEVVLATHAPGSSQTIISLLNFTITPTLGMAISDTVSISDTVGDVSLAVGDLDGDRAHNEVVIGAIRPDYIRLDIFEYLTATQTLDLAHTQYITYTAGISNELELATGYIYSDICGDKMLIALLDTTRVSGAELSAMVRTYCFNEIDPGNWQLELSSKYRSEVEGIIPELGYYHSDIDAGDLDVDGYDEIVYSYGDKVVKYDPEHLPEDPYFPGVASLDLNQIASKRSLSVGDIDRDGVREIVLAYPETGSTHVMLFEVTPSGGLMVAGEDTLSGAGLGTVLMGDLDNDTYISELKGCMTNHDPTVVAVVNGAPRWYQDGEPIQDSFGSYSKSESGGGGTEDGTVHKLGGSITLGYETEAPIIGSNGWKKRFTVTGEFMHTWGLREREMTINAAGTSLDFSGPELGLVVYYDTIYACFYYTLFPPGEPQNAALAMTCRPTSEHDLYIKTLNGWHSDAWKASTKSAWVDIGHRSRSGEHTNDIGIPGNYPRLLPVDEFTLFYDWPYENLGGLIVGPSGMSVNDTNALKVTWYEEEMNKTLRTELREYSGNFTAAYAVTIGGFLAGGSATYGFTKPDNTITTWGDSLKIGGGVYMFDEALPCYEIVPYVYFADATTLAGTTYKYLEADYYVPRRPWACAATADQISENAQIPR